MAYTKLTSNRPDNHGWSAISVDSDGIEILQKTIAVTTMADAVEVAEEVSKLIASHIYVHSESVQITLRNWRVEVVMAVPREAWFSKPQEDLARAISDLFDTSDS